ncbi:MAG: cytochrome B5 [Chloroflexi bacterium]|nr:cytochrome B5 [Chloroflexota bacterium]
MPAMERMFTLAELQQFDGKKGRPAFIACNGLVYDVSSLINWEGGYHMGLHDAGCDLTEELLEAPHADEMLERAVVVGRLAGE